MDSSLSLLGEGLWFLWLGLSILEVVTSERSLIRDIRAAGGGQYGERVCF
jgi:hypothetical protein